MATGTMCAVAAAVGKSSVSAIRKTDRAGRTTASANPPGRWTPTYDGRSQVASSPAAQKRHSRHGMNGRATTRIPTTGVATPSPTATTTPAGSRPPMCGTCDRSTDVRPLEHVDVGPVDADRTDPTSASPGPGTGSGHSLISKPSDSPNRAGPRHASCDIPQSSGSASLATWPNCILKVGVGGPFAPSAGRTGGDWHGPHRPR